MNDHTFGADQEAIVFEKAANRPISAHRFFPTKENAMTTPGVLGGRSKLYRDGYAVEFGPDPSYCRAHIGENTRRLLKLANKTLGPNYEVRFVSSVAIDLDEIRDAPEDVQRFGCEPSLNAYSGNPQYVSVNAATHPWRYASGHMHISGPSIAKILESTEDTRLLVKMWDRYVAIPLLYLFPDKTQFQRRRYYGKPGEFRIQKYDKGVIGLEYRTPGPEMWQSMPSIGLAYGLLSWTAANFQGLKKHWDPGLEPQISRVLLTGKGEKEILASDCPLYTPSLLFRLSGVFSGLSLLDNPQELHSGWGEFVAHLGAKVPIQ